MLETRNETRNLKPYILMSLVPTPPHSLAPFCAFQVHTRTPNPKPQMATQTEKFMRAFYSTMQREWGGIDRLRMDKYYNLVRCFQRETFVYLVPPPPLNLHPESRTPNPERGARTQPPTLHPKRRPRPTP